MSGFGIDADHLINPALLRMTKQAGSVALGGFSKRAFVPGGDPGMGGGGGAPPGGDPAAGGEHRPLAPWGGELVDSGADDVLGRQHQRAA